jgi:small subunit ribosomal protein S35
LPLVAELKKRLDAYYKVEEESDLSSVAEAVLQRGLADAHSETDDELIEELCDQPLAEVRDKDFESDFDELYETDEELTDLYNARQYVEKKMKKDEFFNMDDTKWDAMVKKAIAKRDPGKVMAQLSEKKEEIFEECKMEGIDMDETKWDEFVKEATQSGLGNMKECEDILEDMLHWDKLLPGQWNLFFPTSSNCYEERRSFASTIFNLLG